MTKISFNHLNNKVCVITGGAGVIGTSLVKGLAEVGIKTAILDLNKDNAEKTAAKIQNETGTTSIGVAANVLDKESLLKARDEVNSKLGKINFLINAAGGNSPKATTQLEKIQPENLNELEKSFFGLEMDGFDNVFALNFKGTLLPTMVFTKDMLEAGKGNILNISSMNSFKPLTKIPAYSAAKASVNNFTQWLAVHLSKTGIRVNAVAPGFFLTKQNEFLLIDEKSGKPTPRGEKIIANTPVEKYGKPEDLVGSVIFLLSDLSDFISGVILPVDGGYSAFGGV